MAGIAVLEDPRTAPCIALGGMRGRSWRRDEKTQEERRLDFLEFPYNPRNGLLQEVGHAPSKTTFADTTTADPF